MKAHIEKPPPPLRQWAAHIPEAVEAVVMKALEKNPDARFASAEAFRKALQEAANPASTINFASRSAPSYGSASHRMGFSPAVLAAWAVVLVGLTFVATRALMRGPSAPESEVEQTIEAADGSQSSPAPQDPNRVRAGPRADQMQRSAVPPSGGRAPRSTVRTHVPPDPPRINTVPSQVRVQNNDE
jgi:serine/threonine-protein kinase